MGADLTQQQIRNLAISETPMWLPVRAGHRRLWSVIIPVPVVRRVPGRYAIDEDNRTVWLIYASPRHPKDTDR